MIVRAATAVSFPVLFSSGHPDGAVDWKVFGPNGAVLDSGSIAVPADAVSVVIPISATLNTLSADALVSFRDVSWTYTVAGVTINDEIRYSIEARVPFGASADGVRSKLGLDKADLSNSEIELVSAYYAFEELIGVERVTDAILLEDDHQLLVIRNAIEALAALALVPTMQVRVASKESSGTNQFQRQKIDWSAISNTLQGMVNAASVLLIPGFDLTENYGPLFVLATPDIDPFTGAEASR